MAPACPFGILVAIVALLFVAQRVDAQPSEPPIVHGADTMSLPVLAAGDASAHAGHVGDKVVVTGTIRSAEWSRSGKVMRITFDGVDEATFGAAVFERNKKRFDDSFGGDFRRAIVGSDVRLTGQMQPYGGYDEAMKRGHEILLLSPRQVTITKLADGVTFDS